MKLVAYLRVSTDRQAEEGNGLDIQEKSIRRWARNNGHRIVAVLADEGVSGAKPAQDRPNLAAALAMLRQREAHGLIVRDLDRLARAVTIQEAVLAEVWANKGAHVFTAASGEVLRDDPDDPIRQAMREMVGVFAGLDRRMIVKRLRDGRTAKAAKGGHANGRYPYGHNRHGKDPAQQAALKLMVKLRDEGHSTRAIAEALTEAGHPTARGGTWSSPTVARILSRYPVKATAAS